MLSEKFTFSEVVYRSQQPRWLASQAWRYVRETCTRVSPTRFASLYRKVRPLTMCSYHRLLNLHRAILQIEEKQIPGDVVECGVARGGSAALMALTLNGSSRKVWMFDTFQGLPKPSLENPDYRIASLYTGACRGSLEDVQASFRKLGIDRNAVFVPGLFQDTLPDSKVGPIALLHVDGDWYESVMVTLNHLYDRVPTGGIIQFDDYGHWAGARRAVDEFMRARGITFPLKRIDFSGRQLTKA